MVLQAIPYSLPVLQDSISGATSMAAGEYISVKSQEDIEKADLHMEHKELQKQP